MDSSRQACSRTAPELSSSWDPAAFAGLVTRLASVAPCDSTIPPYRRLVIDSFYPSGCTYLLLLCPASTTTVMSTPASATTSFTVPWGRGTGRRAGVLLTVSPSSFCFLRLLPLLLSPLLQQLLHLPSWRDEDFASGLARHYCPSSICVGASSTVPLGESFAFGPVPRIHCYVAPSARASLPTGIASDRPRGPESGVARSPGADVLPVQGSHPSGEYRVYLLHSLSLAPRYGRACRERHTMLIRPLAMCAVGHGF